MGNAMCDKVDAMLELETEFGGDMVDIMIGLEALGECYYIKGCCIIDGILSLECDDNCVVKPFRFYFTDNKKKKKVEVELKDVTIYFYKTKAEAETFLRNLIN